MNDNEFSQENQDQEIEEELENAEEIGASKLSPWVKAVALLVLLAFIAMVAPDFSYLLTDKLGFLEQNKELTLDAIVQQVKPGVVTVEAVVLQDTPQVYRGTGFNISPAGTIITNQHIVDGSNTITIIFNDGSRYSATQYSVVTGEDLAIIRLAADNLPALEINPEAAVKNGDLVTVIGNPLGFEKISQRGKVGRFHKISDNRSLIFDIDIPVHPGSSGSPVINDKGQVIGVVFGSTTMETQKGSEVRALAIPINALPDEVILGS